MTNGQVVGSIVLFVPLGALYVAAAIGQRRTTVKRQRAKRLAQYDLHPIEKADL